MSPNQPSTRPRARPKAMAASLLVLACGCGGSANGSSAAFTFDNTPLDEPALTDPLDWQSVQVSVEVASASFLSNAGATCDGADSTTVQLLELSVEEGALTPIASLRFWCTEGDVALASAFVQQPLPVNWALLLNNANSDADSVHVGQLLPDRGAALSLTI